MKRKNFARLCILLSLTGLVIMYLGSSYLAPERTSIEDINQERIGENVRILGNVTSSYSTESATFLTVEDSTGSISVVDFESGDYREGEKLEVIGGVEMHRGDIQVSASRINRLDQK